MNPLELAANLVTAASILLAGRNSVHTWWTGIVGCGFFAIVFLHSRLYADTVLQCFFVVTSIVGWWQWLHGRHGEALAVTDLPARKLVWQLLCGALGALGYGLLLRRFTNAYAPFLDSTVLAFSIVAQLLMMRRHVQSWPFWVLVNSIAVPLYASRGLYLTSALYAVYWINALVSWRHWLHLRDAPPEAVA
jgi:nicotinamide mononucleotide transporter